MKPARFKQSNAEVLSAEGEPSIPYHTQGEFVTTRWRVPFRQRVILLFTGNLWVVTASDGWVPMGITVKTPFEP